ncbi:MAG TPA: GIY-YIG nuclease family protein [Balneolales bacterium]|nr:GIY-YIG nuclease family protein [Balneolales bacterium]
MWFLYILYSSKRDTFYIGSTNDLQRRLNEHNNHHTPSTRGGEPWELVYQEDFENKSDARKRERAIKAKKSRSYIEYLINSAR